MTEPRPIPLMSFKRVAEVATSRNYMGNIVSFLVKGNDTGGRFALVEYKTKPGNEPPPHIHLWENELYYVLEGELEFHHGSERTRGGVGDTVFLPQGEAHTFCALTPLVRTLILVQSIDDRPVGLDRFFAEMSEPAQSMALPSDAVTYAVADLRHAIALGEMNGTHALTPDETSVLLPHYPRRGVDPSPS